MEKELEALKAERREEQEKGEWCNPTEIKVLMSQLMAGHTENERLKKSLIDLRGSLTSLAQGVV
ncbi:MAG: hypothetical protein Crog4KO_36350 [Crocinitomicaceae bacterium]